MFGTNKISEMFFFCTLCLYSCNLQSVQVQDLPDPLNSAIRNNCTAKDGKFLALIYATTNHLEKKDNFHRLKVFNFYEEKVQNVAVFLRINFLGGGTFCWKNLICYLRGAGH